MTDIDRKFFGLTPDEQLADTARRMRGGRMTDELTDRQILDIALRELRAVGTRWRLDWSDFDGRTLRSQLEEIASWAEQACNNRLCVPLDHYSRELEDA